MKISRTQLTKFAKKISLGLGNKGMWREIPSTAHARLQQGTTKLHVVAKRVQHHTTSRNKRNVVWYNICLVKSLIAIELHTTRYNVV